jgi:hypothetical protein
MGVGELPSYTWNADLVAYDGPLLSLYRSAMGGDALFVWLDRDERAHRWAIVEIDRDTLRSYLTQSASLLDVFMRASTLYIFDNLTKRRTNLVATKWDALPREYLPGRDSFLTGEISTAEAQGLAADPARTYSIGLDGELFIEDIAAISRLYQQLYSFHYGLAHLGRAAVRSVIVASVRHWTGGFNAVNLFSGLSGVIPSIHRPRIKNMQYASPGHIQMELLPAMAQQIYAASQRLVVVEEIEKADALYKDIYKYFKENKISGFESEHGSRERQLSPDQMTALSAFVTDFLGVMNWNSFQHQFTSLEIGPLAQLRALLAYYRRLRSLVRYQRTGKITFSDGSST